MQSQLKKDLILDEGDIPHAYQDHLGFWTIGVGFLIDKQRGGYLPEPVRDLWLDYLIKKISTDLASRWDYFNKLGDDQKRGFLNMAYQMGVNGLLKFKNALAAAENSDWNACYIELLDSRWAKQTPRRARKVAALICGR